MKHAVQLALCLAAFELTDVAQTRASAVEILRDQWGIPHVFSDTDVGAFYGLGYATAEDRAFQMTYSLRMVQGRLCEVVGEIRHLNRNESSIDHDRRMRVFGFYRAARRTADKLDPETSELLQAYCDGVNDYFQEHQNRLHPLFAQTGLKPEPWTPADCLASWWHLGQFFATDGTRELIAGRNESATQTSAGSARGRPTERGTGRSSTVSFSSPSLVSMPPDDAPAVVKRGDVSNEWVERVLRYAREHGFAGNVPSQEGPKFSHAWVVGGRRTTTGSAVLVSDPQTAVRNPSLFYEFHVRGKTFNARGIGVPGSPILLIGFTDKVAWGVTALGADQADLFMLKTDAAHPNHYEFDGQYRPMTVFKETIRIKGQDSMDLTVRETHLGPVITEFSFAREGDPEIALKRIPICETNRETVQAAIAMMRAEDAHAFDAALAGWQFPSINIVFGDRMGNIGYRVAAAIPVRSRQDATQGRTAQPGHKSEQDWQGIIPHDLLPGVINPGCGYLYSGNHRPIESWYPLPLGAMTGTGGDTVRSWRLRERLEAQPRFVPEDVFAIHFDAVNPARRDIVRLGLHMRDELKRELSQDARAALAHLEPWYRAGAKSSLDQPGAELALELNTFFRVMSTDLAQVYGGGESGLSYFLKTATSRLDGASKSALPELEQQFIERSLEAAWQSARRKYGPEPEKWNARAREAVTKNRLGYYEGLHGFPALDPAMAVSMPPLVRVDGGTIGCQTAQSYTQWVPMHDPDLAMSILPIGQSEWPEHPARTSTLALWAEGRLHPAPLSRAALERISTSPAKRFQYSPRKRTGAASGPEISPQ